MSKYRPEKIELKCPTKLADRVEGLLKEQLHDRAKLRREDVGSGETVFSFYPTKDEYLLVGINLLGMSIKAKEEIKKIKKERTDG